MELKLDKSTWKPVTFGDVVQEVRTTIKDPKGEGIERVVGLEHIEAENIHLSKWASIEEGTTFTKGFKTDHVLFGRRRAYLKKAAQAGFDGICSGDITVMEAKDELLPELLPFLVCNDKFFDYAVKHSAGGLSPRTKFKDLANYEFLLPPKEQQAKLAELLWAADAVVENRNQVRSKLGNSLDAAFAEALNTSNSEAELKEFGEIVTGSTPSTKKAEFWDGDIPFITPGDIDRNPLVADTARSITDLGLSDVREIPEGSIMVVSIGATIGKVGIAMTRSATNQQINTIIPYEADSRTFLFQALRYYKTRILARSSATTLPIINKGEFSKVRIPVPSVNGKGKFNNNFEKIDRALQANEELAAASKQLLKSLINQIF